MAERRRMTGNERWQRADTEKARLRREAVLHEASLLFNQKGFAQTSLQDVADSLGISKSALYYYVSGKEDLVFQCHLSAVERSADLFAQADQRGATGLEKIQLFLKAQIGEDWGATSILSELELLTTEHRRIIREKGQDNEDTFRRFIQEGIDDGSIAARSPKMVELAIMGSFCWLPRWYKPDGDYSLSEIAEEFVDLFVDGLQPRD